jgi:hypothetical protein
MRSGFTLQPEHSIERTLVSPAEPRRARVGGFAIVSDPEGASFVLAQDGEGNSRRFLSKPLWPP